MLSLQISLSDNEDSITRTKEFDEDSPWTDMLLACADVISAKYGYDVSAKVKFISKFAWEQDRANDHTILEEDWKQFLELKNAQQELNLDDEEWS
jgi:hypothetical protein